MSNTLIKIPRENNLNLIRLFLAFIVLCRHSMNYCAENIFNNVKFLFPSDEAVFCFYILSGFLITASYENSSCIKEYFLKRFKRIFPAYWVVIFLSIFVMSFVTTLSKFEYWTDFRVYKYLIANFFTIGGLAPNLPGVFETNPFFAEVNGALWTIKIEIGFYLILPIICLFLRKIKKDFYKNVFLFSLYFISFFYKAFLLFLNNKTNNYLFVLCAYQTPGYINYFVSGMILYYNFSWFAKNWKKTIIPSVIYVIFYFIFKIEFLLGFALVCILFVCAFILSTLKNFRDFYVNDYSYGVYIYHAPIVQMSIYYGFFKQNPLLSMFLIISASFFCGYISWHLIEKRVLKR